MTPVLTAVLAELPPVSLEELVGTAALLTRVDRKYVLPPDAAAAVLGRLPGARVLAIGGQRGFGYDSVYVDTPGLAGFHLAARGRRRRFKVRQRTYTDAGESWVEVKTRGPRGATVKERVAGDDVAGARRFVDDVLVRSGIDLLGDLVPVLGTRYTRTTLLLDTARVTVDADLVWRSPSGGLLPLVDRVVVETKSGSAPSTADRLLWRAGHRPARISKYGTGLAALHPELPRNRWHATLTRHLATHTTETS
ncbi:VTC domain-containing protein [Klenkia soli]|uniref:VTC domain-containing protein n=1 Tax=Klenkia soli TaxID=1052260 RepID=A0A1H0EWS4_9ACTN|nr:VTC domain-containing protein [Klenkia soli]